MKLYSLVMLITLCILNAQRIPIDKPACNCTQILSEDHCNSANCRWQSSSNQCLDLGIQKPPAPVPPTPLPTAFSLFCQSLQVIQCSSTIGCAWTSVSCTHFTGCSTYMSDNHHQCQVISKQCVSDGTRCTNILNCNQYTNVFSCYKNTKPDSENNYCHWDEARVPKCQDANTCGTLPKNLFSDEQCRSKIPTCTVNPVGGCIESGATCQDQLNQIQCHWNKNKSQQCYWDTTKCVDKICNNAANTLITDNECNNFLSICTTKLNGGCVTRTTCSAAMIQAACVKNSQGGDCFWNGTDCVDKTCLAALTTLNTNFMCSQYKQGCITKLGGGCVDNGVCGTATIEEACKVNASGQQCVWNVTCRDKTCINAPPTNNTLDLCVQYLPECTVNSSNNGCQSRTCENALISIVTTKGCNEWLPNKNCITKLNGGCMTNTTCQAINIQVACLKDVNGQDCFWDVNVCKDKTCINAPSTNNTHDKCYEFLNKCTVNLTATGCVDKTCEVSLEESLCKVDYMNRPCGWQQCYKKQCSMASTTNNTHLDCFTYSIECTVKPAGGGCMDIPSTCSALTSELQCVRKNTFDNYHCGWNGSGCIDRICSTARPESSFTTTVQCGNYKSGCVVQNDENGCMDLPGTCAGRQQPDNCSIGTNPECYWANNTCQGKSCATAIGNTFNTNSSCESYFTGCITNAGLNGCIVKPASCAGLNQTQCKDGARQSGDCYWLASNSCVDKVCVNLVGTNFIDDAACMNVLASCTVNSTENGCVNRAATCEGNLIQAQCVRKETLVNGQRGMCFWAGSACRDRLCSDAPQNTSFDDHAECSGFMNSCTVGISFDCVQANLKCTEYLTELDCGYNKAGYKCVWDVSQCRDIATDCSEIVLNQYSHDKCHQMYNQCKMDLDGSKCVKQVCSEYTGPFLILLNNNPCQQHGGMFCQPNGNFDACFIPPYECKDLPEENCYMALDSKCRFDTTCKDFAYKQCNEIINLGRYSYEICAYRLPTCTANLEATLCESKSCDNFRGSKYSYITCQEWVSGCVANNTLTKCITQAAVTGACEDQVYSEFTHENCLNAYDSTLSKRCMANPGKTGCIPQDCEAYSGPFTVTFCHSYLCSVNPDHTKCITAKPTCELILNQADCYVVYKVDLKNFQYCNFNLSTNKCEAATSTNCDQITTLNLPYTYQKCKINSVCTANADGSACVFRSCDLAKYAALNSNAQQCNSYHPACQAKGSISCIPRQAACSSYTEQSKCLGNASGVDCIWRTDLVPPSCIEKSCTTLIPANHATHSACQTSISTCTIKANGNSAGQGCINKSTQCSEYTIQEQCVTRLDGVSCYWNSNLSTPLCQDKSCGTALKASFTTHLSCYNYISGVSITQAQRCTVSSVSGVDAGCQLLSPLCTDYISAGQCVITSNGVNCAWNGVKCLLRSQCESANPSTQTTHQQCFDYLSGVTINQKCTIALNLTNQPNGCMTLTQCQSYTNSTQCVIDSTGKPCFWNTTISKCEIKSCGNAPTTAKDAASCASHLSFCTLDNFKCQSKTCADFSFPTDLQCRNAIPIAKCTSNGTTCYDRSTCDSATTQIACTTDINNKQCYWNTSINSCSLIRSCYSAPTILISEAQCQDYLSGCTTKLSGGCTIKSSCAASNVKAACTTSTDGTICVWEQNVCRNQDCQDLKGINHFDCVKQRKGCTIGSSGYCTQITTCSRTPVELACVVGTDGPCLWVDGKCYNYTQCQSLIWTTDEQCKKISPFCTTNGSTCTSITTCALTNTNGGCVMGTDGPCIQTVSALNSTQPPICKLFKQCSDAYYNNHDECQKASTKCTTDLIKGCIELTDCNKYTIKESCVINKEGRIINNGITTSTGKCTWDTTQTTPICRNQQCSDLIGTDDLSCKAQLQDCTFNGIKCINQHICSEYTQGQNCSQAMGKDGKCVWDIGNGICRIQQCKDIQGITTKVCSSVINNCVSDGIKCIELQQCKDYTNEDACNYKSLDGICIWSKQSATEQGKCKLMTECSQANDNQRACVLASDRCKWTAAISNSFSSCSPHTCATSAKGDQCQMFNNWNQTSGTVCSLDINQCIETNPQVLKQKDCYILTNNLFTWDQTNNRCVACNFQPKTDSLIDILDNMDQLVKFGWLLVIVLTTI